MEGLTTGRNVHYVAYNGAHLAAIVIGVHGDDVDLAVFTALDNAAGVKNFGMQFHQNVKYSHRHVITDAQPGTWHWIERV